MIAELSAAAAAMVTTTALTGYLSAAGTEVAKTAGKETFEQSKRLVGWLRGKLGLTGREALADLREEPSAAKIEVFRNELEGELTANPTLLQELRAVLAEMPEAIRFAEQNVTQTGDNNKAGMAQGQNITISIG